MPRFWSLIGNGEYTVGCTGRTVYVHDKNNNELAKFKDLPYAYTPCFSPNGDIFIVKTTEGRLAVYSLAELKLIKKFRYSKVDGAQDDGFCFSPDGKEFFNIERHTDSCKTALSIYDTTDFSLKRRLFLEDTNTVISQIEYDKETDSYYILGFFRPENKQDNNRYFVSKFYEDKLCDIRYINNYNYFHNFIDLKMMGFTEQAKEWSGLKYSGYDLSDIENEEHSLAKLWSKNHSD